MDIVIDVIQSFWVRVFLTIPIVCSGTGGRVNELYA